MSQGEGRPATMSDADGQRSSSLQISSSPGPSRMAASRSRAATTLCPLTVHRYQALAWNWIGMTSLEHRR
jgi:hypothetical protein